MFDKNAWQSRLFPGFLSILILLVSPSLAAQTALNAPPEASVYQALDILAAHKLVDPPMMGQRPYSRLEIARLLRQARSRFSNQNDSYLDRLLSFYESDYARELGELPKGIEVVPVKEFELAVLYNSSTDRTVPVSNGQGQIDAVVSSFGRNHQGKTLVRGGNSYWSSRHDAYFTPYLAVTAEPRLEFLLPRGGNDAVFARVHRLYAKTGWKNIEMEVGRDNLLWGQSENGGLMISSNARPLDMVKVSNPQPWRAPWIFRYLGPMKWTLFASNLGPDQNFSHPFFYGLKWSLQPSRNVEIGLSETLIMGGKGAPSVEFWEPLPEMFPFHKWGGANIGAKDISNHSFGFFDLRVTIPPLRNSQIYYDGQVEDSIVRALRLPDNILNQMSFIFGWYTPRLTPEGEWGIRWEYHHIASLTYRHGRWISGYTLNRDVIGDPLGPTADGTYLTLYWRPDPVFQFQSQTAYEDYDSSQYFTESNSRGGGDRILVGQQGPHEFRYRFLMGGDWFQNKRLEWKGSVGYEYIQNRSFEVGRETNEWFAEIGIKLHF